MPLSGKTLLKMFLKKGWFVKRQKASHVQIFKIINGIEYNETIPMHKELKKGTEKSLLKRLKTL